MYEADPYKKQTIMIQLVKACVRKAFKRDMKMSAMIFNSYESVHKQTIELEESPKLDLMKPSPELLVEVLKYVNENE